MAYEHSGNAPTYVPNSFGRPWADETGIAVDGWEADGEMMRSAYTLHSEDDDFGQPGHLVRNVFTEEQRGLLVEQIVASLDGVGSPVRENVFEYWTQIDPDVGLKIVEAADAKQKR
jgi:catalase